MLALVLNALVWGLSWWPFRQLQALGLHPLWSTACVYAFALVCLLLWQGAGGPARWRGLAVTPGLWGLMLASGLTNGGFNWAVAMGDVVRVVLLFYLMPAWSVLLAWWLLGERPGMAALARLALACSGVLLVLWQPGSAWPVPGSLADWLGLLAGLCFALTNILLLRLRHATQAARMLAMFSGGALLAGGAALLGTGQGWVPALPAFSAHLGWLALALALAFLLGNAALQFGAARLPAHTTALVMLTEVVFASFSAVALGAATLGTRTLLGGGLIVLATVLAALPSRSRAGDSGSGTALQP